MIAESKEKVLRVYDLEPKAKHPTIFEWFALLEDRESFIIENDHDPKPLYYHMLAHLGAVFNWEYLQEGPAIWKVRIEKRKDGEPTVGSIAAQDARKAAVFQRYGIDFCCGGNKTLQQAAAAANISQEELETALSTAEIAVCTYAPPYDKWEAGFLADYIFNKHHKYFYDQKDNILQLLTKVTGKHSQQFPHLIQLSETVHHLFDELKLHFHKEEKVLFPYIKELTALKTNGQPMTMQLNMANGPLMMMEEEHEAAGKLLAAIREITNNYNCPDEACNSFRLLYHQLEELEKDLHQHIHLENNILFPKAIGLEKELA